MKTIKAENKQELIAVEVPMEAYNFDIGYDMEAGRLELVYQFQKTGNKFEDMCRKSTEISVSSWIPHSLSILGTLTDGKADFDVEPYVEQSLTNWKDYQTGKAALTSADSFRSLLKSKGIEYANKKLVIILKK